MVILNLEKHKEIQLNVLHAGELFVLKTDIDEVANPEEADVWMVIDFSEQIDHNIKNTEIPCMLLNTVDEDEGSFTGCIYHRGSNILVYKLKINESMKCSLA